MDWIYSSERFPLLPHPDVGAKHPAQGPVVHESHKRPDASPEVVKYQRLIGTWIIGKETCLSGDYVARVSGRELMRDPRAKQTAREFWEFKGSGSRLLRPYLKVMKYQRLIGMWFGFMAVNNAHYQPNIYVGYGI